MYPSRRTTVVLVILTALSWSGLQAAGGKKVEETSPAKTPEQQAAERYNQGLAYRDDAWRLQKKLHKPNTPAAKREKIEKKLRGAYRNAVAEFTAATGLDPRMHQAYGGLGYAQRQLGDYRRALEAYDTALELDPGYSKAIEYRGEAYLGLNRINDAQNAYRMLQDEDPDLAADLLGAMNAWPTQRRDDDAGVDAATLEGFERWIADRDAAASDSSSQHKSRTW